jgi:hypothetical protein
MAEINYTFYISVILGLKILVLLAILKVKRDFCCLFMADTPLEDETVVPQMHIPCTTFLELCNTNPNTIHKKNND